MTNREGRPSHMVGLVRLASAYPPRAPFHPAVQYAEYPFSEAAVSVAPNPVYAAVRELWRHLGWDASHFGTSSWNPLGHLVHPGDRVLIKPNLICQSNWEIPGQWEEVVTHPSVIRAVVDYVLIALAGRGQVVIADGPQTDSDFDALVANTGLGDVLNFYASRGAPVQLRDLRRARWHSQGDVLTSREELPGDPEGYVSVDLRDRSAFSDYTLSGRFYGADYDVEETRRFHSNGRHEYVLCGSAMKCDVFINLPKMKTHKKTGVTLSLKNLVGINGYRNCLPHHTVGTPAEGGDEFPESGVKRSLESRSIQAFKRVIRSMGGTAGPWAVVTKRVGRVVFGDTNRVVRSGNWHGNQTTYRMVLDLNQCLLWFGREGPRDQRRRYLSIVDGVVGGEGNGPLAPRPVPAGLIVGGLNPWAVDFVAAHEMGLRTDLIPLLAQPVLAPDRFAWLEPSRELKVIQNRARDAAWRPFTPHFGWKVLAGAAAPDWGPRLIFESAD